MPVHFKEYKDVHLSNAPLQEVICQIRFPTVLRIANQDPVDFQEAIMERFPKLEIAQGVLIGPIMSPPPDIERPRLFRFKGRQDIYNVTLANDFLALVTGQYESWTKFSNNLTFLLKAFQNVYKIPICNRIGLRYINVLNHENAQTKNLSELTEIVRKEITTFFAISELEDPYSIKQEIRLKVDEDEDFTMRFTLQKGVQENAHDKIELDFDRYTENETDFDVQDLLERCDHYHHCIYNAFRWSIAENKFELFEPASEA